MRSIAFVACATLALCIDAMAQALPSDSPIIQFRIAKTTAGPGFPLHESLGDTSFFVNDTVVLSDPDIESARAYPTKDAAGHPSVVISVHLTTQAAARLAGVTKKHVGDRMAMFLDRQFVGAPLIMTEIDGGGSFQIEAGQPAQPDRIAAAVAARWPDHD